MNLAWYHLTRSVRRMALAAAGDRKDLLAMHALAPLSTRYLPWSSVALRPSAIVAVLHEIVTAGREQIVELGGGVSTCYLGRLLRQTGGRMWTVEHDEHWAYLLERELAAEGLDRVVTVVRAPLAPTSHPFGPDQALWYAEDRLAELGATGGGIDLLLIDGPPSHQRDRRHLRYPAVPYFASRLAPGCAIVLDDILRRGEQEILYRWEAQLGIRFDRRILHGSIAVGHAPQPASHAPQPASHAPQATVLRPRPG